MKQPELTLYYDGQCPFCAQSMARLARWDRHGLLAFIDIAQAAFDPAALGLSLTELNRHIVSRTAQGRILTGTASIVAACTLVGHGALVWPLRVPVLRQALSWSYRLFARHRYSVSRWLGLRLPQCDKGICGLDQP